MEQQQQQQHPQQSDVSLHVDAHLLPQSDDERSGQILRRANAPKSARGPSQQQQFALQHQPRLQQDSQTNKTNEHVETPLKPASDKPPPPFSNQSRIPATSNAAAGAAVQPRVSKVHQVLQGASAAQPTRRVLGLNLVGGECVQQQQQQQHQQQTTAKSKQVFFRQVKMSFRIISYTPS